MLFPVLTLPPYPFESSVLRRKTDSLHGSQREARKKLWLESNKVFGYRVLQWFGEVLFRGTVFEENIMKNFDLKSAVIGLLLGVCVMLIVGAGGNGSSEVGRYRMMPLDTKQYLCSDRHRKWSCMENEYYDEWYIYGMP